MHCEIIEKRRENIKKWEGGLSVTSKQVNNVADSSTFVESNENLKRIELKILW